MRPLHPTDPTDPKDPMDPTEAMPLTEAVGALVSLLTGPASRGGLLVVTGAGVSHASGIPTFRGTDRDAIWKRDVTELGTYGFFEEDPVGSWRWYLDRFAAVLPAAPNAAHVALVALERAQVARGRPFLLVTQNVDVLHERAGSKALVKVHGSADRVRCVRRRCVHAAPTGSIPRPEADIARFAADPRRETLPRCPACGDLLRQHVLWFDEAYASHASYDFERALDFAMGAAAMLFVGTSFSVGATDAFVRTARVARVPVASIDPGDHPPPPGVTPVCAKAEEVLPEAVRRAFGGRREARGGSA